MLKEWFLQNKRSFPWRENPSPYAVWISEIMLQQTRASVVVEYFNRWMSLFPTIEALAKAPLADVLKAWEGLGYYNRARNIKASAEMLAAKGGTLPNTWEELLEIKGIGSYTAGAILSFAFHKKAPAVDGNVKRVVSRLFGEEDPKTLERNTLSLLPDEEPWITMEALIELGATLCQKKPSCQRCPLQKSCFAFQQGKTEEIPKKKSAPQTIYQEKEVAIIVSQKLVLVEIMQEGKVLGGLAQFPAFLRSPSLSLEEQIAGRFSLIPIWEEDLPSTKQTFTNHIEELYPFVFSTQAPVPCSGFSWVSEQDLPSLCFSSGHKRILHTWKQRFS